MNIIIGVGHYNIATDYIVINTKLKKNKRIPLFPVLKWSDDLAKIIFKNQNIDVTSVSRVYFILRPYKTKNVGVLPLIYPDGIPKYLNITNYEWDHILSTDSYVCHS